MTNHWVDIKNADLVLIMGGNAAEAHPCGFKWVTEAKAHRKAKLIVVDPRFTRSAAVSDFYAPIRAGTDIAFLGGVINYLLSNDKIHHEYVKNYTDFSFLVNDAFAFDDGIFSGYNPEKRSYDKSTWGYQIGADGYVVTDPTLQNPRCVYQMMKAHYSRYTPDMVSTICGTPKDAFLKVCEMIAGTAAPDKTMTIMYALGWTQHSQGSQMIRTGAMVQLLLGNIGVAGGGMNALRGHSNIQGLTDLGLLSNLLPGYMTLPGDAEQDYATYIEKRAFKPLRPGQLSYWQNYNKFFVSIMKAWYGDAATAENNWCYDWLPKLDKGYDLLQVFENMNQGKVNGYICQGFNPLASAPCKVKVSGSLAKLKYLVIIDPLATETSEFWQNHGEYNDVDPAKIQTEVFRLPSTCFAEEDGSLVNSGRWLQWHWKAAEPPGDARNDQEIMAGIFLRLRDAVQEGRRRLPRPHPQPDLEASPARGPLARGTGEGILRQGAEGRHRPEGSGQGPGEGRRAVERLCRTARRRLHFLRLLDLLRCLDGEGQPDGAARQQRSLRHRADAELGFRLAGQPAHAVQPRLLRSGRQALRSDAQADRLGRRRRQVDRFRRSGLQAGLRAGRRHESLHHEPGRRGAFLRGGQDGGRPLPRALRADGVAAGDQPAASEATTRRGPIRPRGCSRTTGRASARRTSSPMSAPPTASPSTSTSGPSTRGSTPSCSRSSSWKSARNWRRRRASRPATTCG